MALKDPCHTHLASSLQSRRRVAAADHSSFDLVPIQPAQGYTILRIKSLGFNNVPLRIGHKVKVAIRKDPIHVHQKHLYLRRAFDELLLRYRRIGCHAEWLKTT